VATALVGRWRTGDRVVAAGGVAGGKTVAAERNAWICFEDEAGQTLPPPKARTWGRRGQIIKNRLKSIQYRTHPLDGYLAHTGLALEPDST
jgi:hypothetical protein